MGAPRFAFLCLTTCCLACGSEASSPDWWANVDAGADASVEAGDGGIDDSASPDVGEGDVEITEAGSSEAGADVQADAEFDAEADAELDAGPPPELLLTEAFADTNLADRGWSGSLTSCVAVADVAVGHPVVRCSFVAGTDPPVGGTDGSTYMLDESIEEYTLHFKQRVSGGIVLGDQTLHGFYMMSDKGVHSPANSYGTMYFDPLTQDAYAGEWALVFQDNKALDCSGGTQVDLFATTEDRSVGGCQTPTAHHPEPGVAAWCWGDACAGGLETYSGQSGWSMRPNLTHPVVTVGQWVEFTYYVRLNTPGVFDGRAWMSMKRPGDAAPIPVMETEQLMMRANGWNADMAMDKVLFGPWASSNSYDFEASFADLVLYRGDARALFN